MLDRSRFTGASLVLAALLGGCDPTATMPAGDVPPAALSQSPAQHPVDAAVWQVMASVNEAISLTGQPFRVERADWLAAPGSQEIGRTVFFDDRTLRLDEHFVPGDPRRGGRTNVTWQFDRSDGAATGLTVAATEGAVDRAMATLQALSCSNLPLAKLPDFGLDLGFVEFLVSDGAAGLPAFLSDVTHAGFGSLDAILPVAVLGVTFTFVFVDADGVPTDVNRDGRLDVAFREIYYNNARPWGIGTAIPIDVETVALHEAGHGLSQGHFGALFQTTPNGLFHFAPRSVMNAGYTGVQQELVNADVGGHCGIWGRWPRG